VKEKMRDGKDEEGRERKRNNLPLCNTHTFGVQDTLSDPSVRKAYVGKYDADSRYI